MALAISFALLLLSRMALPQNPCMVSTRACVNLPAPPRAFPSANFFVVMKASIKYSILLQNRWRMAGVGEGGRRERNLGCITVPHACTSLVNIVIISRQNNELSGTNHGIVPKQWYHEPHLQNITFQMNYKLCSL